jgi:hypothetical protein
VPQNGQRSGAAGARRCGPGLIGASHDGQASVPTAIVVVRAA